MSGDVGRLPCRVRKGCALPRTMRAVVIRTSGNFGARIARALQQDPAIENIPAGRIAPAVCLVEIDGSGFEMDLVALRPGLVTYCARPFQGQDYRVARAALAAGARHLDLANRMNAIRRSALASG